VETCDKHQVHGVLPTKTQSARQAVRRICTTVEMYLIIAANHTSRENMLEKRSKRKYPRTITQPHLGLQVFPLDKVL
jgi:hypothetical protein